MQQAEQAGGRGGRHGAQHHEPDSTENRRLVPEFLQYRQSLVALIRHVFLQPRKAVLKAFSKGHILLHDSVDHRLVGEDIVAVALELTFPLRPWAAIIVFIPHSATLYAALSAVATENPAPESSTVTREAFVEDVLKSIKHPPEGMTAQEVRDRLLADLLYRLSSAESMVGQVVEKIQSGGIGSLLGGLLGKGK